MNGKQIQNKLTGFTLIELLLVMVIVSIIIYAGIGYVQQKAQQMRVDRTSMQMQQILNAALSYYVVNGSWPPNLSSLQGTYLANIPLTNPWGKPYSLVFTSSPTPPALIYVYTPVLQASSSSSGSAAAIAKVIAGTLPLAYTSAEACADSASCGAPPSIGTPCSASSTSCAVVASVNIPGQNLNNARAVNFANVYHHGGCVPVPACPVDAQGQTMTAEILLSVVQASGVSDTGSSRVYPIESFTAYYTGGPGVTNPPACQNGTQVACNPVGSASGYWRACIQIWTEKGDVSLSNSSAWGNYATLLAITRCSVVNEPSGSPITIYSR